jgi:glutathione synthase/RimK-type ligase-like ATP-grasp enzyme
MTELVRAVDKSVLIASSGIDRENWEPVAIDLTRRGYDVTAYEADKVAQGTVPLEVSVTNEIGLDIRYGGQEFKPAEFDAAWYRRSTLISTNIQNERARQIGLDSERKVVQAAMWAAVPERAWLNSPSNIRYAEQKLTQLALAHELGFTIPDTVSTNRWEKILGSLPEDIVFKISYVYVLFCEPDDIRTVYTTPLKNNAEGLPIEGNPFPGFWQPKLNKAREWRITAVGDTTFDAAIYTDDDAKDDWRKHYDEPGAVEFKDEAFPEEYRDKCFKYLGRFGLRFGTFDFIEDDEGQITFLECNANGQYKWLEDSLGFPISTAIASELAAIAEES